MEVRDVVATYCVPAVARITEVGLLPSDWTLVDLSSIACVTSGKRLPLGWSLTEHETPHPYIRVSDMENGTVNTAGIQYVPEAVADQIARYRVTKDDLYISVAGTLGVVGRVPVELDGANLTENANRISSIASSKDYLYYVMASSVVQGVIESERTVGAQPKLALGRIRSFRIPLPPTTLEQGAIAEALSDSDALIESLSLLLAKKRQIKQGAMQELLTGKKRLPGFRGAWTAQRLSQLGDFLKGRGITRHEARSGKLPCVRYGEIYTHHQEVIQRYASWISPAVASIATRLRSGDVLFAGSGETKEEIGKCTAFISEDEAYAGGDIVILRTRNVNPSFLSYLLNTPRVQAIKASRGQGDAVVHISSAALAEIEVSIPDRDEQTAIADVLAEMDDGIAVIQAKLDKAHDIKQGMMQALLTGRIRLVQPTSNVIPLHPKPAANLPTGRPAHNWQINEAVVIGVLAQRFGSEQFPLPRKRRVKLTYLLHRHAEGRAEGYLKKAAGPYDPNTKYKGPEQIALKNGYVRALRNEKYEGFVAGEKIEQAQRYFEQWYGEAALEWLERFHYRKTDDLELLATLDMAMVDLAANGEPADLTSVKRVIAAHPEWLPKLSRELFSDERIAAAIAECRQLFG